MGDSAYSFSLTTFSRTGKLLQIEYALNAVANGRTSLGIAAKDGVVIATDKKLASSLVDTAQVSKVESVGETAGGGSGMVYSGVGPDYRVLGEFLAFDVLACMHIVGDVMWLGELNTCICYLVNSAHVISFFVA